VDYGDQSAGKALRDRRRQWRTISINRLQAAAVVARTSAVGYALGWLRAVHVTLSNNNNNNNYNNIIIMKELN
jgi:hypothetical protein